MSRFVATILVCLIFIVSGLHKITEPDQIGDMIMKSPFPKFVKQVSTHTGTKIPFGKSEARLLSQAIGASFLLCSALLIVGVARCFASSVLILQLIAITAFMHLNLEDPKATSIDNQIHVMKNLAIMGGLMLLGCSGSGKAKAAAAAAAGAAANKKRQ